MKNKKFHIYNLRNGREEKVYDIPLSTGEEKSPMSHYGTLLAATLIVRARNITRKCEEPEAAVILEKAGK